MGVERAFPGVSFERMVHLTNAHDGSGRVWVVLQPGEIFVLDAAAKPLGGGSFLDIRDRVSDEANEEGLLGLAFPPDFSESGHFFVYYTAAEPRRSVISRFALSGGDADHADPSSEQVILEVPQPFSNHNGGTIEFGPDGFLYVALGDGGSGGDPTGNGQNRSTLLGSLLRIDVSSVTAEQRYRVPEDNPFVGAQGGERGEIWAYGLRNPWKFSFDPATGDLWAGDVGQRRNEEVDVILPGRNYGWNVMEGFECFRTQDCDTSGLVLPIVEYSHDEGCSITGGYVYRGSRLPELVGAYVYGDFCSGRIWALRYDGERVTEDVLLVDTDLNISSFGMDEAGELYILSFDGGIYRLV